jgi:hypothetical protein
VNAISAIAEFIEDWDWPDWLALLLLLVGVAVVFVRNLRK